MNARVHITEHERVDAPLDVTETITIPGGDIPWGSEAAGELLANVRAFCGLPAVVLAEISDEHDFAERCYRARLEAREMLYAAGEITFEEAIIFPDESFEMESDEYAGLPATFAAACRKADARQRRAPADPAIESARRLLDDNISFERVWAETNSTPGKAASATFEALMFALRERGVPALDEPNTRQRLAELSDEQVIEAGARLRRIKPEIARAWTADEIAILMQTRASLK